MYKNAEKENKKICWLPSKKLAKRPGAGGNSHNTEQKESQNIKVKMIQVGQSKRKIICLMKSQQTRKWREGNTKDIREENLSGVGKRI